MVIPKIIHQTWKTENIPERCKKWVQSWKKHHPDYEYKLWTDKDNRDLMMKHYPKFIPVYDSYKKGVYRADIARYVIMYHYGGLYVDLDFECLKNMDPIIEANECFFGYEPHEHFINNKPKVCNALFGSNKYNPLFIHFLREAFNRSKYKMNHSPVNVTGPEMITDVLKNYKNIKIYNSAYFYPLSAKNDSKVKFIDNDKEKFLSKFAYAQHHWMKSWIVNNSC